MNQAMQLIFGGLQCDSPGCDYRDESAVPDESLIGKICPECGASLLTAEDMANIRLLQFVALSISAATEPVPEGAAMTRTPILMDGTGKMEFGEPKIEE